MSADTVAVVAPRSRSDSLLVTAVRGTEVRRQPDELIVEEPMSIQLDGNLVATTMRTPGHDYELAVGFCFGAGKIPPLVYPASLARLSSSLESIVTIH